MVKRKGPPETAGFKTAGRRLTRADRIAYAVGFLLWLALVFFFDGR